MPQPATRAASFAGLRVVAFESRHAAEMAALITKLGGVAQVAPSMRELPLEENPAAFEFAAELLAGRVHAVIFMTGVGTRTLFEALATRHPLEKIGAAISRTTVVARGPKSVKALGEFGVPVNIAAREPNTWREILASLDEKGVSLRGRRVAVQEYGASNGDFLEGLRQRGAEVLRVPVYRWALPENLEPLRDAAKSLASGDSRVALFTNAVQVEHLLQVAQNDGVKPPLLEALRRSVVGSVGPTCSEALAAAGIGVDFEPAQHKMGALVLEAARNVHELLPAKSTANAARAYAAPVRASAPEPAREEAWADSRFMRACRRLPVDATPVWLMRQAGRYMKEYRDLRARVPFLELCKNSELAAEITVTAAEKLGADAAIIFSDLLLILEPLGFKLEYDRGEGPIVKAPLRQAEDAKNLPEVRPDESLAYVYEAIRRARAALKPSVPLLGFAAGPFTLASYLIEGGASRHFRHTKALMYGDSSAWQALMERLARSLASFVNGQIRAGVQAVQIFDTWIGCLGRGDYRQYVQPHTRMLMEGIARGTPIIHFGVGTSALLEDMRDAGGDVIGLDWRTELDEAWRRLGNVVGVQGNLDPVALFAGRETIRSRVERVLKQAANRPGHIFNLGHGILPDTPFENVVALVEMVHELSAR